MTQTGKQANDPEAGARARPREGADLLDREPLRVVDLSRDIFEGMPLWPGHQLPFVMVNQTHEGFCRRWNTSFGFEAHNWLLSEHAGTHTDAIFEYDPGGATLDDMPLQYYYGDAICLDVSHVRYPDYFTEEVLARAEKDGGQEIRRGDIVLLYTGHGDRTYPSKEFVERYAGLDRGGAEFLAKRGAVNVGVDALAIDHSDDTDFVGHRVCAEYQIVNTENLTNLDQLVGERFLYFGLPLHFREGTGSPVRAIAVLQGQER
jgi:kynurenine formamidase